jgi:rSAM/selenodomain-associated transferase 1
MISMTEDRCLVMFVKFPDRGEVKSRLSRGLGEEIATDLYRCFIEDLLEKLAQGDYRFRMAFHPEGKEHEIREMFGGGFSTMPQEGKDLGERMKHAFIRCFSEGFCSVVVIGSDSPDLPARIIEKSFLALEDHDAVIGPSADGGYYLIGFTREAFHPDVFSGLAWGAETIYQETMDILHKAGALAHILPVWQDVDRPEDITILIKNSKKTGFAGSKTISYLRDRGLA